MPDDRQAARILPYSYIVGQSAMRLLLELAYINPAVGGVLLTGERGTAKSTVARAFGMMMYGDVPVTLPVNATDDRVLGGWDLRELARGETVAQPGLLERANGGILYVDEVNLLDDHLVNAILDVTATGLLEVQQDGLDRTAVPISFVLVGTMNPEEGGLRPQMLDRFGLVAPIRTEADVIRRTEILRQVLRFERESADAGSKWLLAGLRRDEQRKMELTAAHHRLPGVSVDDAMLDLCAQIAITFDLVGHRGDKVMLAAARAHAALADKPFVGATDLYTVAPYAIMHRRRGAFAGEDIEWSDDDRAQLSSMIPAGGRST